ncbi:MAG TPA: hypothetical protein VHG28_22340 [Longimicrobiaceae bacterium]|nr:hypothetical protein [Longimicrobiaceae bacterium]
MTDGRFVAMAGAVATAIAAMAGYMLVQLLGDAPWRDAYGGGVDAFGVVLTAFGVLVVLGVGGGALAMFLATLREWRGTVRSPAPRPAAGSRARATPVRARAASKPARWSSGTAGMAGTEGTDAGAVDIVPGPWSVAEADTGHAPGELGGEYGGDSGGDSGGGDSGGGDSGGGGWS